MSSLPPSCAGMAAEAARRPNFRHATWIDHRRLQMKDKIVAVTALILSGLLMHAAGAAGAAGAKPRARDLGVPFDGAPGPLNAITDVPGVTVGFTTLIKGEPPLQEGVGPIRTGVTAILPRGKSSYGDPVFAGWFRLNGNGEMTGTTWGEEGGLLSGPVMITNTHSVGVVRDAVISWLRDGGLLKDGNYPWALPVVAETWDG